MTASPRRPRPNLAIPYRAPSTPHEEVLAHILAQIFDLEQVGVDDDYFALGGDSMRSVILASTAREHGLELNPEDVVRHPTVARLAPICASGAGPEFSVATSPQDDTLIPLTPLQHAIFRDLSTTHDASLWSDMLRCTLKGALDDAALRRSFELAVSRHAALRAHIVEGDGGEPWVKVDVEARLPWRHEDLRGKSPAAQAQHLETCIRTERERGFAVDQAPLLRIALVSLSAQEHVLIVTNSHLILDGWSKALLLREVFTTYDALLLGQPPPPAPPEPSFAAGQRLLASQDTAGAEAFWRPLLASLPAGVFSPLSGNQTPPPERPAAKLEDQLEESVGRRDAIEAWARSRHLPVSAAVYGTWALVLASTASRALVGFGSVVSGRRINLPGVASLVGLLNNLVVFWTEVPQTGPMLPWLQAIAQRLNDIAPFEWTPTAKLRQWANAPAKGVWNDTRLILHSYLDRKFGRWSTHLQLKGASFHSLSRGILRLDVWPLDDMIVQASFDRHWLEPATARALVSRYRAVWQVMMGPGEPDLRALYAAATSI